ncbi:hypothetical protein RMSM_06684 [Rhodopirellula maiorica SM1]|uniref:Uncharacterized protein n=1 Tax=Rhodopirellula maiorica SM1 TaxID=1265738 RepID=M5RBG0_9BACT|nr:DUF3293 domain-containing protein [Rhodopirellula maiorica]EMI16396.1 hypothetical protein RMSM_06684 [Rhodopirellula maiorica SM1]
METSAQQLDDAYRKTIYWCESPEQSVAIRIGHKHPVLDDALRNEAVSEWAFITAYNPHSTPKAPSQNRAMNEQLECEIARLGYLYWHGTGIDPKGQWPPEASFLLLGIMPASAANIGRKYHQNAIVIGRVGGAAELLFLTSETGSR